jgi:hypothetical protein
MGNINPKIVEYQRRCVERYLPHAWIYHQHYTEESHGSALNQCLRDAKEDVIVLLDIDCIPLSRASFSLLRHYAEKGVLTGAVQRANHVSNREHLYVGPFCMALSRSAYNSLGRPSFSETDRGDVGEELTYRWQETKGSIFFLWPSHVENQVWPLIGEAQFGYGTTYDGLFYHAFCIREGVTSDLFITRCKRVMSAK